MLQRTADGWVSDGHVVITGPIAGSVTTEDGTVYDVSAEVIEVESHEHAAEIAELIGQRFEAEGHPEHAKKHAPDHPEYVPFTYVPAEKG